MDCGRLVLFYIVGKMHENVRDDAFGVPVTEPSLQMVVEREGTLAEILE